MSGRFIHAGVMFLLMPSLLLLISGYVNGENGNSMVVYEELESDMDFPWFEELEDGYWWNGMQGMAFHSNGMVYWLTEASGYITVPTVTLIYGKVIDIDENLNYIESQIVPGFDCVS